MAGPVALEAAPTLVALASAMEGLLLAFLLNGFGLLQPLPLAVSFTSEGKIPRVLATASSLIGFNIFVGGEPHLEVTEAFAFDFDAECVLPPVDGVPVARVFSIQVSVVLLVAGRERTGLVGLSGEFVGGEHDHSSGIVEPNDLSRFEAVEIVEQVLVGNEVSAPEVEPVFYHFSAIVDHDLGAAGILEQADLLLQLVQSRLALLRCPELGHSSFKHLDALLKSFFV